MSAPAAETRALEKRYGHLRALRDLSLEIAAGSLTLVSGPNGAGKTTLLRILGGLTRPTRGGVRVLGGDPFGAERAALRGRSAYSGAETGLYGELTLAENLAFGARLHGASSETVHDLVSELGLGEQSARRVRTLSLGYRRRAGLARALLCAPALLLLDEPWNGLDREAGVMLAKHLTRVRERGGTALVAAHAPGEHRELFDTELELAAGRLAESHT